MKNRLLSLRAACLAFALLPGCATLPGVVMTDTEAKACKQWGCTVWTDAELQVLIQKVYKAGYADGVKSL